MKRLNHTIAIGSLICFSAFGEDQATQNKADSERQQPAATAQEKNRQSTFKPGEISDEKLKKTVTEINKATSFMGMQVKNLQNEDLGKVQDLVFDPQEGRISYVVLSTGGFLGVAQKSVAIPLKSIQAKEGANHLVIDMTEDQIKSAPGLAQNNWPPLDTFATGAAAGSETGSERQAPPQPEQPPRSETSSTENK